MSDRKLFVSIKLVLPHIPRFGFAGGFVKCFVGFEDRFFDNAVGGAKRQSDFVLSDLRVAQNAGKTARNGGFCQREEGKFFVLERGVAVFQQFMQAAAFDAAGKVTPFGARLVMRAGRGGKRALSNQSGADFLQ